MLLLCQIPGHHLGTNFSHPQFFSQYQTNGFPVHVYFYSNHSDLIFDQMEQVLLPVPCCHLSAFLMVIRCAAHLQQEIYLQRTFFYQRKACAFDIASSPKAC